MDVSLVPIHDVLAMSSRPEEDQELIDYFGFETTQNCQLNCRKTPQIKAARKTKPASAVYKTDQFALSDVASSAGNGCRGCKFLAALLTGVSAVYTELDLAGAQTRIRGMPESNILTGNTSLPLSFDRVHAFLQNCEATHSQCGSGRNVPLPKRLINVHEITLPGSDGEIGIRLESTEDKIGTYACLSHCWGDASQIHTQTQTTNIGDYHRFIAWSDLPKTFRDAVILTRRLGVGYLWIDSLCIIQDSRIDWEVESVKMGEIYRNSYVTIAASASRQSSGGCFSEAVPDSCLLIQEPDHPDIYVGVRDCQGAGQMNLKKDKEQPFNDHFPLFTRAWVYQERMLSRRILFCNKSELQIGCQARLSCECGGGSIAPHFKPAPRGLNVAKLKTPAELKPDEGGGGLVGDDFVMLIYRNWLEVVESYAKLNITKPSDRLPALSATAKIISQNMGSEYLAGIWRVSLMEGLLWHVRGRPSKPRPAGSDWRAPSWSWASVDAPEGLGFIIPGKSFSPAFNDKIEAAKCELAGANKLGEVTSGFIRLKVSLGTAFWRMRCRGCATPVRRTKTQGTQRSDCTLYTTEADGPLNEVWTRCAFAEPALDLMGADLSFYADEYVGDASKYGFFKCIGKGSCKIAPCYLLHVPRYDNTGKARGSEGDEKRIQSDAFLVLTKLETQENTFERVGLALISHRTESKKRKWSQEVWSSVALPETTITLV